jgi:hypothetical protein
MSFLSTRERPRATGYLHRQEPGYTYGIQVALTLARAVALAAVHPQYTISTTRFGASISEAAMRPNPA